MLTTKLQSLVNSLESTEVRRIGQLQRSYVADLDKMFNSHTTGNALHDFLDGDVLVCLNL